MAFQPSLNPALILHFYLFHVIYSFSYFPHPLIVQYILSINCKYEAQRSLLLVFHVAAFYFTVQAFLSLCSM